MPKLDPVALAPVAFVLLGAATLLSAEPVAPGGTPALAADESALPAHGGNTGTAAPLDCQMFGKDHVMVGIQGRAKGFVDALTAVCVKLNANGSWTGATKITAGPWGGPGGDTFTRTCDNGWAVSGIAGRAGEYFWGSSHIIHRVRIRCRRLAAYSRLTGDAVWKDPAGGSTGSSWPTDNCPDNKPGRRLLLRVGAYVDRLQLTCDHAGPWFGENLFAVFQHVRCQACHSFNNSTIGLGTGNRSHAGRTECVSCHTQALTGASNWHAPSITMDFAYKSKREICLQIKQGTFSGSTAMRSHLRTDPLILWGITNGKTPDERTQALAVNGNVTAWRTMVDAWVSAGMLCD